MTAELTVPCERCRSTGHRELTKLELDTLVAVGDTWSTTSDIRARLAVNQWWPSPTALCNRLVALLDAGLVERRAPDSKHFEWRCVA